MKRLKKIEKKDQVCSQKIKRDQGGIKLSSPGAFARDTGGGEGERRTAAGDDHLDENRDEDDQFDKDEDGQNDKCDDDLHYVEVYDGEINLIVRAKNAVWKRAKRVSQRFKPTLLPFSHKDF